MSDASAQDGAIAGPATVRFVPARAEHSGIILTMMRALEDTDPGTTPFDEQRRRVILDEFLRDATCGRAWLIFAEDKVAGYVVLTVSFSFEYRGRDAYIDELYIAEDRRGWGLGRRTMEFVEGVAGKLGVNAIHLEVSPGNHAALELHRRSGYTDHGRHLMTKWLKRVDGEASRWA